MATGANVFNNFSLTDNNNTGRSTAENLLHTNSESVVNLLFYCGILFFITFVNIVGNSLAISVFLRHPVLRRPCNYFIISLAASDLLLGLLYTSYNLTHMEIAWINHLLGDWRVCNALISAVQALQFSSSYNLVAITVSRYIVIMHPLGFEHYLSPRRVAAGIATIWLSSQLLSAAIYQAHEPALYEGECRYELVYTVWHILSLLVFSMIIPLTIMISLYIGITNVARKQARIISAQGGLRTRGSDVSRRQILGREMKSTKMVAMLLGFFAFAWTPFVLYAFVKICCETCQISDYIRATTRLILHMNSAVNVFIYAGRLREFRTTLRKDMAELKGLVERCCKLK